MPETKIELLTLKEAAEELKLKVSTLRTYCREGRIPCSRFGTVYRVRRDVLERLKTGDLEVEK
jgi:excisionase family DNA binding protein